MDFKEIEDIVKFIENTDIVEFELERPNGKIRIKRGAGRSEIIEVKPPVVSTAPSAAAAEYKPEEQKTEKEAAKA